MRIFLCVLIWVVIVGGLGLYMNQRGLEAPPQEMTSRSPSNPQGRFVLEITTGSNLSPDPFAVLPDPGAKAPSLLVRLDGREILRNTGPVEAGSTMRAEGIAGVEGAHEIYLEASPGLEDAQRSHALRVRMFRNGQTVAEETLWSRPGWKIADTVRISGSAASGEEEVFPHEPPDVAKPAF